MREQLTAQNQAEKKNLGKIAAMMEHMQSAMTDRTVPRPEMMKRQQRWHQLQMQAHETRSRFARSSKLLGLPLGDLISLVEDCTATGVLSEKITRGCTVTYIPKQYTFIICPFEFVMQRWEHRLDWENQTCLAEQGFVNSSSGESNVPFCSKKATKVAGDDPDEVARLVQYCESHAPPEHVKACVGQNTARMGQKREGELRTYLGVFNETLSQIRTHWVFQDPGPPCQNGLQRQVNVTLVCGATGSLAHVMESESSDQDTENKEPGAAKGPPRRESVGKIRSAVENGMCNYEVVLETLAACIPVERPGGIPHRAAASRQQAKGPKGAPPQKEVKKEKKDDASSSGWGRSSEL